MRYNMMLWMLICFVCFFSVTCEANKKTNSQPDLLSKKINNVLAEFKENLNVGIVIEDLRTGQLLYQVNADRYFTPASNQKLFTALAALNYLGPRFVYQTQLFADLGKVNNTVLNDNLYLKFAGDPTLTFAQLDHMLNALTKAGIKRVNGSLIIDDSAFDQTPMSPGMTWDDQQFCYAAPIQAIILDHNCMNATLTPAASVNQPAVISLSDQQQFIQLNNQVMTRSASEKCSVELHADDDMHYTLSGCVKITDPPINLQMAIKNPRANLQLTLDYLLKKNQVTVTQPMQYRRINIPLKLLAMETSPLLQNMVVTMLKDSDNTIANALFKTMGAMYFRQSGSWDNGSKTLHDVLTKTLHFDLPKPVLVDGSGSSRYNYLTPQQLLTLLHKAYYSQNSAAFIEALPISGIDGTLKDRMNTNAMRRKVFAKTGTEAAVTSLSGYIQTNKKHTLAFVIMVNSFIDSPIKYKALEDKICTAIVDAG